MRRALGLALGAVVALASPAGAAEGPRLVLLLVVDQLRPGALGADRPGGLGRLVRNGRFFLDGVHDHAHTETCPGHVVLLSGRHPGNAGVPGNRYVDPESGERVYCVEDVGKDAQVFGSAQHRSPRGIHGTMLGDWMKEARPGTRVFSVSGKDRAAIATAGKRPDAAYWFDAKGPRGFTTSRYYQAALPEWVQRFNGPLGSHPRFLRKLPEQWVHHGADPENGARRDDYPNESSRYKRTSPHPLRHSNPAEALQRLLATPFLDDVTLAFAEELVRTHRLGRAEAPDLLILSLSANDLVGHRYGPESQEVRATLIRLDRTLGRFLDFLDAELGPDAVLVALTSDHGVLPLPEWLVETGRSRCPLPGGRADALDLIDRLEAHMREKLDPSSEKPDRWLSVAGARFTVRRDRAKRLGVPLARAIGTARAFLEKEPGIERVWSAADIEETRDDPLARLYRNSRDPERSGDLEIQPVATCLFTAYGNEGTSHGTPYLYDRAVPILFAGPGVTPGRVRGPAATVDIGPTLAGALGIPTPKGLDGRALELAP